MGSKAISNKTKIITNFENPSKIIQIIKIINSALFYFPIPKATIAYTIEANPRNVVKFVKHANAGV